MPREDTTFKFVGDVDEEVVKTEDGKQLLRIAKERLQHGRKFRQDKREKIWLQSEQQYEGSHWSQQASQDTTADLITVNISFSTIETIVPYLTGSNPRFIVEPYSVDASDAKARAQGAWVNRFWRSIASGAKKATEQAAHDHLIYGDGWGKVQWVVREDGEGQERVFLTVHAISPWDLWLDPAATGLHDARWAAQRTYTTIGELRENGTYQNLDMLEQQLIELAQGDNQNTHERMQHLTTPSADDKDLVWAEIYEFWDLVANRVIVFGASDVPLKIIEGAQCPLVPIENHWIAKTPYHMGDLEQIHSLQQELNKSRSQMLTHRRRNLTKYLMRKNAFDSKAKAALMSETIGDVAEIESTEPLETIFQAIAPVPLPPDAYNVSGQITQDIFEITGVNEYLRGAAPQIRRTATEASIIEGASNIKTASKLQKVEEFVRDLGIILLAVAEDTFPSTEGDEEEMLITGKDAEQLNKAQQGENMAEILQRGADSPDISDILQREAAGGGMFTAAAVNLVQMFGGKYNVEVVQNSTELRNPIFKEQKFREIAQYFVEAQEPLAAQGVQPNLRKMLELWLEAAGIQDVEDMFLPGGEAPAVPGAAAVDPQGPAGSLQGLEGVPNLDGIGPPEDLLTEENTGTLPPAQGPQ